LKPASHDYDKDVQTDKFTFDEELPVGGKATLTIKFVGQLNDKMAGFYRSSYKDASGEVKYMATTQMEPTDARRVRLQSTRALGRDELIACRRCRASISPTSSLPGLSP
jgi:hypothetical protein